MKGGRLALLCSIGALLLTACGGQQGTAKVADSEAPSPVVSAVTPAITSSPAGSETYTNTEWSFSLEYPGGWDRGAPPAGFYSGSVDFSVMFANVSKVGQPSDAERDKLMAVYVITKRLPSAGTDSDFRIVLEELAKRFESAGEQVPSSRYRVEIKDKGGGIGGFTDVPSLVFDKTLEWKAFEGLPFHQRQYIFGKGDVIYVLGLSAPEDLWRQEKAELEEIADSFQFL